MDNCWDYHDGVAEERMGKALAEGGRRDKVFLMTKVCGRTAKDAQSNLEDSLRRLKTDHLDLWQFHEIVYDNDPDWIFAEDGAIHTGTQGDQGRARSASSASPATRTRSIHLKMLGKPYDWATVQMPLNVMDAHYRSFQHKVLPELVKRGIGAARHEEPGRQRARSSARPACPVEDALRYVLSLPIATLVSGIDSEKVLDQNLKIVRKFKPLSEDEKDADRIVGREGRRRRPVRAVQELEGLRRPGPPQAARVRHRHQGGLTAKPSP